MKFVRKWWRGWYWMHPWEYIDGPIIYGIGLGFWSFWWSTEKLWLNYPEPPRYYIRLEWNID